MPSIFDRECEICGEKDAELRILIGGFMVRTCYRCNNEWTQFIFRSNEFSDYSSTESMLKMSIQNGLGKKIVGHSNKICELNRKLFQIGKDWVSSQKKKWG